MTDSQLSSGGIVVNLDEKIVEEKKFSDSSIFPISNDKPQQIKTIDDLALSHINIQMFPTVKWWRERLFLAEGTPEICDELPRLLTEFMRSPEAQELSDASRRAQALKYIFCNKTALVKETDLLPGQTTTSFVGPVVYVDTIGYCIWPELKTVTTRAQNPFKIKPEVTERLNREIFPFWLERRPVQEVARYSDYNTEDYLDDGRDEVNSGDSIDPALKKKAGETPKCQELMERVAFFLSDKATCVSHTVPDFERVLKYGFDGLSARIESDMAAVNDDKQKEFLSGVLGVFKGAKVYAEHLAEAAEQNNNPELARICRKVPAKPAETLHEALSAIWICYHLLLQENTNFGFSIGRLDQLLNEYYLNDWNKLSTAEEKENYTKKAVELVCHFFLRCSDHVPLSTEGSETLFAGSGSNQALTLGGTRYDPETGEAVDAVNDMTYVILKATELLSIRDPNVHARYHKAVHRCDAEGNPLPTGVYDGYLKRISQVNIVTRATPAIHGDAPVVQAMANYYAAHDGVSREEALADALDYASIGCIEQNSAGKHYGNTGSTLMVLPAVLELALYGGKHRSDGVHKEALNLFYDKPEYTTPPLTEMKSMAEFIEAFRFQLDEMARHSVQCNNYYGRAMEKTRSSPFLSGIFVGPTNTPDTDNAKFRDVAAGGAKYNSAGIAIIGLADVIDSFCVIDELVFGGKISAAELFAALDSNFEPDSGNEEQQSLWVRIVNRIQAWFNSDTDIKLAKLSEARLRELEQEIRFSPKYGAGVEITPDSTYNNAKAVKYTHLITEIIQEVFFKYRTHRGGRYLPGYWSMTNHAGFGMLTKATPNGRKSQQPFASGITPCPGIVKRNGDPVMILDHILSVAEVDGDTVQNGYTYNLSLTTRDPSHFDDDTELFSRYMKVFLDNDGVLVQLCVSSIDDLTAAHKAATAASQENAGEKEQEALMPFKDLMIRVAGYSAYFVTLSPQMRQEIIDRSNFALDTGVEQHTLAAI